MVVDVLLSVDIVSVVVLVLDVLWLFVVLCVVVDELDTVLEVPRFNTAVGAVLLPVLVVAVVGVIGRSLPRGEGPSSEGRCTLVIGCIPLKCTGVLPLRFLSILVTPGGGSNIVVVEVVGAVPAMVARVLGLPQVAVPLRLTGAGLPITIPTPTPEGAPGGVAGTAIALLLVPRVLILLLILLLLPPVDDTVGITPAPTAAPGGTVVVADELSWMNTGGGRTGSPAGRLPVPLGPPLPMTRVWSLPGTGAILLCPAYS